MAKKRPRSDAERRLRQCERLSRLLRALHLIMGKGRRDVDGLAPELECSRRTVYRLLQTLSMAGVPWYFDDSIRSYRVRPGFKFPAVESTEVNQAEGKTEDLLRRMISDSEAMLANLKTVLTLMSGTNQPRAHR